LTNKGNTFHAHDVTNPTNLDLSKLIDDFISIENIGIREKDVPASAEKAAVEQHFLDTVTFNEETQ